MDDLISRKATISAMEGTDWYHINSNGQLVHGANSKEDEPLYKAEDVYKVLNDVPSAQQRWIPCSERLPEKEEQVLIYAWNVHYVLAKYREIRTCDGVYKMAWVTEDAYSAPREIKHEVICWMPLPEPYAERRTDE